MIFRTEPLAPCAGGGAALAGDVDELGIADGACGLEEHRPGDLRILRGEVEMAQIAQEQQARRLGPPEQLTGRAPQRFEQADDASEALVVFAAYRSANGSIRCRCSVHCSQGVSEVVEVGLERMSFADASELVSGFFLCVPNFPSSP